MAGNYSDLTQIFEGNQDIFEENQIERKGFFKKSIFDAELTATEQSQPKELAHFEYLTFTFDSQLLAEQFDAVFRRAITICGSKK